METATNVQWEAIPHIISGKDVVCRAKTGSGKTAAFALPILEHLSQDPYGLFLLYSHLMMHRFPLYEFKEYLQLF